MVCKAPLSNSESATFSFVIPVYNEQESLNEFFERMSRLLDRLGEPSDLIFVDDGSTDQSYELLRAKYEQDKRFKVIRLSRNFGHQIAISAGLDFAEGQAVIVIDGDLQDPPEAVLPMVAKWREGFEIVYGVRAHRHGETWAKEVTAKAFYRLLRFLTDLELPLDAGDFRLVDRKALDAFRKLRERNRYVRGMFSWIGFRQIGVEYVREKRCAGRSKYPFRKMWRLALNAVVAFSDLPLRLALRVGFLLSSAALLYALLAMFLFFTGHTVRGWASLVAIICFIGGGQLMVLGIIGEYIARIYDEVKGRPLYLVAESLGVGRSKE